MNNNKPLIKTQNITKYYMMGETEVQALKGIDLEIFPNEFLAITGTSGSGKSTLMHILGCLDVPTSGTYLLEDVNIGTLSKNELAHIRNQKIGFIFQRFHLLPDLTALDNVALPQLYAGVSEHEARRKAKEFLTMVELSDRVDHYPYQLSGGQQQRVAVARSLVNNPRIIFADEPTGNLDSTTGQTIMELFKNLHKQHETTLILVTHESEIAEQTERIISLADGRMVKDEPVS